MRTNEHVAGQWSLLFRWPVLEASKTIEIFNVKGDFFFFWSGGALRGSTLINIQHKRVLTQQVGRSLSQSERLEPPHTQDVVSTNKKNISGSLLPSFYTFNDLKTSRVLPQASG